MTSHAAARVPSANVRLSVAASVRLARVIMPVRFGDDRPAVGAPA